MCVYTFNRNNTTVYTKIFKKFNTSFTFNSFLKIIEQDNIKKQISNLNGYIIMY